MCDVDQALVSQQLSLEHVTLEYVTWLCCALELDRLDINTGKEEHHAVDL